jgi:MscS family membrane protein
MMFAELLNELQALTQGQVLMVKVAALLAVVLIAQWLSASWLNRYASNFASVDAQSLTNARRPLILGIWWLGLSWMAEVLQQTYAAVSLQWLVDLREPIIVVLLAWFVIRVISALQVWLVTAKQERLAWDASTAEAMTKVLKVITVISAILILMQLFGLSISGVLAFGGVGGIAIGFAAKDMLANFFGGLMIYMDRQFAVGDWIRSPDKEIEGTVEHIGWRVTRIRTFDMRPLYVPNSTFTNISVENPSRMSNRRFYETFGLRYADQDKVEAIVADVKAMLLSHEAIDTKQTLMVNLNQFNSHSVDFFVYSFTKTTNWAEFHGIKQDLLKQIAVIVEQHGAEFAFPTQSIYMEQAN